MFSLPSKLLILIKVVFFFPSLTHFFITAIYWRFSTGPAQTRKQSAHAKTCFSFKIKDQIILFQLAAMLKINLRLFKACVCYFSLFLKDKCISSLFQMQYIEKNFNLQLFFLATVSRTFILSRATTHYPPPWNFLIRNNNCMCNRDNACDVAACSDE